MLLDVFVTNLDLETATIGAQNALGFPMHLSGDQHGIIALTRWIGKADHQSHFAQGRNLRREGGRIIRRLIIDLDRLVNRLGMSGTKSSTLISLSLKVSR